MIAFFLENKCYFSSTQSYFEINKSISCIQNISHLHIYSFKCEHIFLSVHLTRGYFGCTNAKKCSKIPGLEIYCLHVHFDLRVALFLDIPITKKL